jgi:hypothetical protein
LSERNKQEATKKYKKLSKKNPQKNKLTPQFIILKIYLSAGMENLFLIGSINYMALESNINVKFVVTTVIGEEELSKCIFKNGDIHMV